MHEQVVAGAIVMLELFDVVKPGVVHEAVALADQTQPVRRLGFQLRKVPRRSMKRIGEEWRAAVDALLRSLNLFSKEPSWLQPWQHHATGSLPDLLQRQSPTLQHALQTRPDVWLLTFVERS